MTEADWRRLLSQVRSGEVVPVVGPGLLVGADGQTSLTRLVAEQLLASYGIEPPAAWPRFHELDAAVALVKKVQPKLQCVYGDVHGAIDEVLASEAAGLAPALGQLAQITDFRLFVTLTSDDLLERCLARRCAVNAIVHAPKLPSSRGADLPVDWRSRAGEAHLLYLFGKSCPSALFAIHDEDVLEYAHNMLTRGSQVPRAFLGELQTAPLLLLGCNFPDWLTRFFLRLTNTDRLATKDKSEWVVEPLNAQDGLAAFLGSYSSGTELLSAPPPVEFVAQLHQRWMADQQRRQQVRQLPSEQRVPPQALFFVSYSRTTDQAHAQALVKALLELGASESEIWFDRHSIAPGQDFQRRILEGIRGCRYFLPLLSQAACDRNEAFLFQEWDEAAKRLQRVNPNEVFVLPLVVDAEFDPDRYTAVPLSWHRLDYRHAPEGRPSPELLRRLRELLRRARDTVAPAAPDLS